MPTADENPGFAALAARAHADVLILGGGINGLAAFRDLAMQGVDVALVERADYVSGASAASSHMIHGGVRYLENGEFRLVHEAVTERNALLKDAPHYVRPLQTTIPIFSTFSGLLSAPLRFLRHGKGKPRERGAALIKIGLVIYDSFSRGGGQVPRHTFYGRKRSLRQLPELNPRVKYTATYWDASVHDPERLAIDVLRDGISAGGDRARAANYTAAVGAAGGGIVLRDEGSGAETVFTASVVVNATGPWVDLTNAALGDRAPRMGGTKGSHIVVDSPELLAATGGRELFFENEDGRIVLIYPLQGRVLIGTTDLEHDMREPAVCTEAEVDYFIDLVAQVLPSVRVDRSHIVYRFSGVRPLPRHDEVAPGFVSRDYRIDATRIDGTPAVVLSLVGGKWTTFRASAERLADTVLTHLGVPRRRSTKSVAIGGGQGFPATQRARVQWVADHTGALPTARVDRLLSRYGTVATEVIAAIVGDPGDAPLTLAPQYSSAELRHVAATEHVRHLDDVLMRRTSLAFIGAVTPDAAREVAEVIAPVLGWDDARVRHEIDRGLRAVRAAEPAPENEETPWPTT
ncbi:MULTISPECIES: glycerol-3-phosphate dehydrogenase/oxidase [unclassified Microbacterium]|uniref:glycerol-3-phosphate dehydrogenase/oxidase n=1 Tax=unclassified Microbacterium TaxID=2609290 RepID=UPI00214C3CE4|nr:MULTISPECIES: glycerol-3-phosphate dehydrogenase/oxidase [unclassified Microbacterium]MCR2785151.1 glycerol-3-phosphate dehydrogenase/oxidase [Microbacterium sp. zg.B96]MDL5352513.1 glycerol-3-phosphate dehydrogenase/oxidase [Microbacterium sp. zg-YB36]WIM16684.1 glycerol-3-phosphate dehydrogenase/oxidase [Microbacterium sp. zg-B96]